MPGLVVDELTYWRLGPFSFTIAPGECVGLQGPSGAGKSLLLRAIADLDDHGGLVSLGGVPQSSMSAPDWRSRVGLLTSTPAWWLPRVGDHLVGDAVVGDVDSLLADLGFPSDVMDWPVDRLSSGESQRLALARLLCRQPEVLLLDEPTAHVDPDTRTRVEEVIAAFRHERCCPVLWVGHDPNAWDRLADRVLKLRQDQLEVHA